MSSDGVNAFGDVIDPGKLSRRERLEIFRAEIGRLLASRRANTRWLGQALATFLHGSVDHGLTTMGVRPEPGDPHTASRLLQIERIDIALLNLAIAAGSDVSALKYLRGAEPCPYRCKKYVIELHRMNAPRSLAAFVRARKRHGSY